MSSPKGRGVIINAPDQGEALGEFGNVPEHKNLNHKPRGGFPSQGGGGANPECDEAVYAPGSQDAALGAIAGAISGGGKNSSEDKSDFAEDVLNVGTDSDYGWNKDSPWSK